MASGGVCARASRFATRINANADPCRSMVRIPPRVPELIMTGNWSRWNQPAKKIFLGLSGLRRILGAWWCGVSSVQFFLYLGQAIVQIRQLVHMI